MDRKSVPAIVLVAAALAALGGKALIGLGARFRLDNAHALTLQSAFEAGQGFGVLVDDQGCDTLLH